MPLQELVGGGNTYPPRPKRKRKPAPAPAPAPAPVKAGKRRSVIQKRAKAVQAAQRSTNEAAADAALKAAYAKAKSQALMRARQRAALIAAKRRAASRLETQRLLSAARQPLARADGPVAIGDRDRVRQVQKAAAERRHHAYQNLMYAQRRLNNRWLRDEAEDLRANQLIRMRDLKQGGSQLRYQPHFMERTDQDRPGSYVRTPPVDKRRSRALHKAKKEGDWSDVIKILDDQSKQTGGRYVDPDLYEAVQTEYVADVVKVGQDYEKLLRQAEKMLDAENAKGLMKLINSAKFTRLEEKFRDYFGDGRKPGSFGKHAKVLTEIAARRERVWVSTILDPSGQRSAFDSQRLVDQAYRQAEGMTYREQVLDPATGEERWVKRTGIDAYLARETARQQDALIEQQRVARNRLKIIMNKSAATGDSVHAYYEDGRLVQVNLRLRESVDEAVRYVPDGQARLDQLMGNTSPAVREELLRSFMRDAAQGWEREHGVAGHGRDIGATKLAVGERNQFLTDLKEALTGDRSGYGFGDALDQSYGFGDLFRAGQLPLASIMAWLREQRARGNFFGWNYGKGDFNRPTVNINPFEKGSLGIGTEVDPEGKAKYEAYQEGLLNPDPNVRAAATRQYGTGVIGGNVGWLVEGAADPLNFVAPSAWLARARLALVAAGGLRAVNRFGGLPEAVQMYLKYSTPAFAGGLGRGALKTDLAKLALARETGVAGIEALRMSDDELRELAQRAVRGREELAASDVFERIFERSDIDKEQLLNIVQAKLPKLVDDFDLMPVDPFDLQKRIRAAREGFVRAEQQAEEAAQLERRRVAQQAARDALERARVAAGRNVGQRVAVTPANLARHEKLLTEYVGATREYSAIATRANRAADELEKLTSAGAVDRRRLLGVHAQLGRALRDMRRYEDQYQIFGAERKLTREGLVSRRYKELAEFRTRIGGDPSAPSYTNLSWALVRQDRKMITSRIRGLQRALARAKVPADMARLRAQLTEAHKARVGIEFEAALLDRGRTIAKTYGRRQMDRVGQAVRPQRLAQKATNDTERAVETSRDLSNRLGSVSEVEQAPLQTAAEAQAISQSRANLQAVSGADIVAYARGLQARTAGARFAGESIDDVIAALESLASRLGVSLSDLSLEQLMLALYRVQLNAGDKALWAGVWKLVASRAGVAMRAGGFRGKLSEFIDALSWEHVRSGASYGLARHEELDELVAGTLRDVRGFAAEGVARGGRKRYGQAQVRELLRPDTDPVEVLAKMRALEGEGVDLFQYDRARGVLGDIMVRRNTSAGILDEARAMGGDLNEAFLKVRAQRAQAESLREFEEFASRVENQGRAPAQILRLFEERYVGRDLGTVPELRVTAFQERVLREAWREQAGFDFDDQAARARWLQSTGDAPPLGDRSKMRDWLVENGYWSPRTGEQIASGERVWSIDEERALFEKNWGFTPPWTDREVLAPLMDDQRALRAAFAEWGFFDDGFEALIGGSDLTPEELLDAVTFGRAGFAGKRTLPEMRDWAKQRYGDLVVDHNDAFIRMPWLMEAETEYIRWLDNALSDAGRQVRRAEWEAAVGRLPEPLREAFDEGFGMEINRALLQKEHIDKLGEVIASATRRRIERLRKNADLDPGEWLPQEQLRFAYDVANELLADPRWRGLLRGSTVPGAGLHIWSQFWRMLVSFQPAFPIMNLIETSTVRRWMLAILENGFRPLSLSGEGKRLIPDLGAAGLDSSSLFYLSEKAPYAAYARLGDKMLPVNIRGGAAIRATVEAPLQISKFGEDRLRLDFARSVADRTYRAALGTGMAEDAAVALAQAEAKRVVSAFFVAGHQAPWLRALNQVIPFFSYNYELKRLAFKMIWNHPAIVLWADRMRHAILEANREAWAAEYGDAPFPENDPSSSWLWIPDGNDGFYSVDLSSFSDWTRALADISGNQDPIAWASEFFRIPHPSQQAMLALLTGGVTPWGKPGDLRELFFYVDLWKWLNGQDYERLRWQRDWVQMTSQMLFFKKFGHITPLKAKLQQYFWFRDLDPGHARTYLEENPDLQAYFDQVAGSRSRPAPGFETKVHWYSLLTDEQRDEYNTAYSDWKDLNATLDEQIFAFANAPWSEEYKAAKREAFIARTVFLKTHPILPDSWGVYMSPEEFAAEREKWLLDDLQDAFFSWSRPAREDFKSELAYQQALVDYYEQRKAFLTAHPALAERLYEGRNAIENAWHDQELQWSETLEFQAKLKLRILEEQEKPDAEQDRGFIDVLYGWRDAASLELDAESYARVYGVVLPGQADKTAYARVRAAGGDLLRRVAEIPGFSDFLYGRATPEERADMRRNEWYARSIAEVVENSDSGKDFYDQLFKNPALLQEYWRRNPDAKARYKAGQEYFRWISSWVSYLKRDDFSGSLKVWNSMPAWVRERYLSAHPDSGMADGMGMASSVGGSSTAVQYGGKWFKSPESRASFIRGQEYFAAISRWVELLKAKDYVAADRWFRQMPAWMREKYYAKHPDQRADNELDSTVLRQGAEYFLASGDDKLAILRKYPELRSFLHRFGGDEEAMRGLVMAMYRAIPSSDAWIKRLFRERFPEVFSQEALGERKLQDVVGSLAEHPEMLPFYRRALKLQTNLYLKQLQLSKAPPKPLTLERKTRLKKRRKRRIARLHSNWTLHRDLRRHRGE